MHVITALTVKSATAVDVCDTTFLVSEKLWYKLCAELHRVSFGGFHLGSQQELSHNMRFRYKHALAGLSCFPRIRYFTSRSW